MYLSEQSKLLSNDITFCVRKCISLPNEYLLRNICSQDEYVLCTHAPRNNRPIIFEEEVVGLNSKMYLDMVEYLVFLWIEVELRVAVIQ
jgi:hypothetical protein